MVLNTIDSKKCTFWLNIKAVIQPLSGDFTDETKETFKVKRIKDMHDFIYKYIEVMNDHLYLFPDLGSAFNVRWSKIAINDSDDDKIFDENWFGTQCLVDEKLISLAVADMVSTIQSKCLTERGHPIEIKTHIFKMIK